MMSTFLSILLESLGITPAVNNCYLATLYIFSLI